MAKEEWTDDFVGKSVNDADEEWTDDFVGKSVKDEDLTGYMYADEYADAEKDYPREGNTFRNTEDFKKMTTNKRKNMFGGCIDPDEIFVRKLNDCFPMRDPRARRAMIRMLRRPVDPDNIKVAKQRSDTCWFYAALAAMFLSDMGRVSNLPLRETMILGRKGYKQSAEQVVTEYKIPLLVLNRTIHILLDGVPSGTEGTSQVTFEQLYLNQEMLRETEAHLQGLQAMDEAQNNKMRWKELLNYDFPVRSSFPFAQEHPLAFTEGITHLTSQIPIDDFRSISWHSDGIPVGNFSTIVRHGVIADVMAADEHGVLAYPSLNISAAETDGTTPKTRITAGGRTYVLDAMVLTSRALGKTEKGIDIHHATACIHLGGKRYWMDSNDQVRPNEYDWYKEILSTKEDITRKLGPSEIDVYYNIHEMYSILFYQKAPSKLKTLGKMVGL